MDMLLFKLRSYTNNKKFKYKFPLYTISNNPYIIKYTPKHQKYKIKIMQTPFPQFTPQTTISQIQHKLKKNEISKVSYNQPSFIKKKVKKMKEKTNLFSITSPHNNKINCNKNNHKLSTKNRSYVTSQSTLNRSGNNYSSNTQLSVNNGNAQLHASGNGKKGNHGEASESSVSRSFRNNGQSSRQNVSARLNAKSYLRDLMTHNVSSIHKEPSERENKDNNVVSRENSESRQKKYSDLSVRSRQQTKSSRRVYLGNKQNKSYRGQQKSTNISILYDDRPHQSQNLNQQLPYKCAPQIHRKLYTFCNQVKPSQHSHYPYSNPSSTKPSLQLLSQPQSFIDQTQHRSKQQQNKNFNFNRKQNKQACQHSNSNSYFNSNSHSHCNSHSNNNNYSYSYYDPPATIVVKEDQLKRFTHKFAREKIQFQEVVSLLKQEIRDLREGYNRGELERQDLLQCLQYKEQIQAQLKQQLKQLSIKYEKQCLQHQKLKLQPHQPHNPHNPPIRIPQAPFLHLPHTYSIQSSQQSSGQNLKESKIISQQIQPYHKEYENKKLNQSIYEQLQYLRNQCINKDNVNKQNCSVIQYLRIQNQYVKRELQIQKDVVCGVREELRLMREKLGDGERKEYGDVDKQIQQLVNQNAKLAHEKQTLQRSLEVSSQIILHIKQENNKLKSKNSKKAGASITLGQLERKIRQMMGKQLQLQDKLKQKEQQLLQKEREMKNMKRNDKYECKNKNERNQKINYCNKQEEDMKNFNSHDLVTDSNLMPISIEKLSKDNFTSTLSHNLQKLYEQGYQSVKRKGQARHKHCKTQSEGSIGYQSSNGRNYTDISYSEEQNNSPSTKNRKQKIKAQDSAKSSALY